MTGVASPRRWLIYTCRSSFAPEVIELIHRRGDVVEALVDNLDDGASAPLPALPPGIPVIGSGALTPAHFELAVTIPLMTPGHRYRVVDELRELGMSHLPPLVDPGAIVASSSELGDATLINTAVVIAANSQLGFGVTVNRSASLGHDNDIEDYATIGPGATTAGLVHVGRGAFLGVGSVCAPEVRIGANAVVGAGAVVVKDVEPGTVVVGNPARPIKEGNTGFGGVAVP
jgi:sugar O-acyltransferase (sialic acid O-acetyltransferase NeuD family)